MSSRIEDYALIGDCRSAALVAMDGSIDWLCWPRFDSGACLAALLGTRENGRWLIAPQDKTARVSRRYRAKTLILETRFETDGGVVTLIDFMPPLSGNPAVVRLVVGERGSVALHLDLVLRFSYGVIVPWVTRLEDGTLRAIAGPDMVLLRTPVHTKGENLTTVGVFTVGAGEMVPFLLTYVPSHAPLPPAVPAQAELEATEKFWQGWVSACRPAGPWSEVVERSLITLKALTYAPTGGMVAAPTTSLPEKLGGERNWDYRYCWLRDATLTLLTLMNAGFHGAAKAWNEWLLRAIAGSPEQLQVMYGLAGERRIIEWKASWLSGYERSRPVRIGNSAYRQRQLDVYGELLDASHHVYGEVVDASHQARRSGLAIHESGWAVQLALLDHLAQIWQEPDRGIWEIRGSPQRFTHSGVMAWVAFDRAIKSAEMFDLDGPIDRWRQVRADIHADVCAHGFNAEIGSFVQCYGSTRLDASLLLLPAVGFLPINDERVRGTIAAIERHLLVDGLVVRYNTDSHVDGLPPGEGAFLACSFWLADVYVMQNRGADAINLFKRLVSLCNDVGLLSEEYDPRSGRLVGNFPQAFSHLALVNTALNLTLATKPIEQRAHPAAEKLELVR
jgi:GH15 family glucan-1,4-alpha-glucosidase